MKAADMRRRAVLLLLALASLAGMTRALDLCRKYAKTDCTLYAVDDHIVWKEQP